MSTFKPKTEESAILRKQIDEFLANGGTITKIKTKPDPTFQGQENGFVGKAYTHSLHHTKKEKTEDDV